MRGALCVNRSEAIRRPAVADAARPQRRSLDAWIMWSPSRAFQYVASQPLDDGGIWVAARRPLFLAFVLGCGVSLLASGTLTLRLAGPATVSWAFVPGVEALTLSAMAWRRQRRASLPATIDAFFAGHGPWILFLIGLAATIAFLPPSLGWKLMTTVWLWGLALVIVWSACIDFCFFRCVWGAGRAAAVRDVVVHRLATWTAVFAMLAVPALTPGSIALAVGETLEALLKR